MHYFIRYLSTIYLKNKYDEAMKNNELDIMSHQWIFIKQCSFYLYVTIVLLATYWDECYDS